MKQGSFIVEFVLEDGTVLYIVRANNGQIVRICRDGESLSAFFDEAEEKIMSNSNIKPINLDGKA